MEKRKPYVVLFPFMAQGHIMPVLALANNIIRHKDCTVTFVSTPLNVRNFQNSFSDYHPSIEFLQIPFSSSGHGLPPDSENTNSLPWSLAFRLVVAAPSLEQPFRKLLSDLVQSRGGEKPLCVVSDFLFPWAADAAHELGIFHAIFSTAGGFGLACFYSLWTNLPHKNGAAAGAGSDNEFCLPDFVHAGKIQADQLGFSLMKADNDLEMFWRVIMQKWSSTDAILFNTVEEIDEAGLSYFRRKLGIPIWAIGPVISSQHGLYSSGISQHECLQWLDKKPTKSVVYISFGSQFTISASQMVKLARALSDSGTNFLWAARPPLEEPDVKAEFVPEKWLPERVVDQERGLIVSKWAPQVNILGHRSVAAFLSHCGWNSILESLQSGVPLICWPIEAEQFYNSKMLVEKLGVAVEVGRGRIEVEEEAIVEKIEFVMDRNGKGHELRKRADEVKELMTEAIRYEEDHKGPSVKALQEFLAAVESPGF